MAKQPQTLGVPHHHIKRAVIWYAAALVLIAAVVWWVQADRSASPLGPREFSLAGKVTTIDTKDAELKISTTWLEKDGDAVKKNSYDRTVRLDEKTTVLVVTKDGTAPVLNKEPITFFKVGDLVTVHGFGQPENGDSFSATKIEVNR